MLKTILKQCEGKDWKRVMAEAEEVRRAACLQFDGSELFQRLLECYTSAQ
jgi:predicted SprT family Zn-dependent metalloprotease